jgi:hypothetical protein
VGGYNTALGFNALLSNATGSTNVALGSNAGRYETGSNSFYLNNIDQTNLAGDKNYSLLYGTFSGVAGSTTGQQLVINGNVGIGTTNPDKKLLVAYDNMGFTQETAPASGCTATINTESGNINSQVGYYITFVTAEGETTISPSSNSITPVNQQVDLTNIPTGSSKVIARRIYRNKAGEYNTGLRYLVDTINDNTTTTYPDNVADGSLGAVFPGVNTTGGVIYLNGNKMMVAGIRNTFFGNSAGNAITSGTSNTFLGANAGLSGTTANQSTFVGYEAGRSGTSASSGTFIGYQAGYNSSNTSNTFIGAQAGYTSSTGYWETYIGKGAGYYNNQGISNVIIGNEAGYGASSYNGSNYNTIIGYRAGYLLGANSIGNILHGYKAGDNLTTGDYNIIIGYDIDAPSATGSNQMTIGNIIYGVGVGGTGVGISDARIGIGTTGPASKLTVSGGIGIGTTAPGSLYLSTAAPDGGLIIEGNVGIGTTNPATPLEVYNSSVGEVLRLTNNVATYKFTGYTLQSSTSFLVRSGGYLSLVSGGTQIGFEIGSGNEKMRLAQNGYLGVGVTSPSDVLDVNGGVKIGAGYVNIGLTAPTNGLLVQGRVGIGTSAPLSNKALTVSGDSTFQGAISNQSYITNSQSTQVTPVQGVGISTSSTAIAGTPVRMSPYLSFNASVWDTGLAAAVAKTFFIENLPISGNPASAILKLRSTDNDMIMAVTNAGNVGIGTTSPGVALQVIGQVKATTGNFGSGIDLNNDAYLTFGSYVKISGSTTTGIKFSTGNPLTEQMRIDASGNVGIGNTAPGNKLTISGGVGIGTTAPGSSYLSTKAPDGGMIIEGNVGIGTTAPGAKLSILSDSISQMILGYDDAKYATFTYDTNNKLTVETTSSTQSMIKIGKGSAQNAGISFDGNTYDYYAGMHDASDKFMIGVGLTVGTTPAITVISDGNVGVGTTSPAQKLEVNGRMRMATWTADGTTPVYYNSSTGDIGAQSSDIRLKENISEISSALDIVMGIRGVTFNWKDRNIDSKRTVGVIAQEVAAVLPELTFNINGPDGNQYLGVYYDKLAPVLVEAVKEQNAMINDQGATINSFDLKIAANNTNVSELQDAVNDKLNIISQSLALGEANSRTLGVKTEELEAKLAIAEQKLLIDENNLATFKTSVNDTLGAMIETENMLTSRVLDHEDRLKALEDRLATMTVAAGGEIPTNVVTADASGNVTLAGIFKTKDIQTENIETKTATVTNLDAQQSITSESVSGLYSVKTEDIEASSLGEAEIAKVNRNENGSVVADAAGSDGKSVFVNTKVISDKSQVFVTSKTMLDQPLVVIEVIPGEGFRVAIKNPSDENIKFAWWVVDKK